jgi:hypothetical protein
MKQGILLLIYFFTVQFAISQTKKDVSFFAFSDCKNDCSLGVIEQKHKGNKLKLSVGIHEHCCHKYEVSVGIISDTLEITYYKYGQPCRCKCNYQLDMIIKKIKRKQYKTIAIKGEWQKDWDTPEKRELKYKE